MRRVMTGILGYGLVVAVLGLLGMMAAQPGRTNVLAIGLVAGGAGAVALTQMPRHWLLPAALAVRTLVPAPPAGSALGLLIPTLQLALVFTWVVRSLMAGAVPEHRLQVIGRRAVIPLAFGAWLAWGTLVSIDPSSSLGWIILFADSVLVLALVPADARTRDLLVRTWCILGGLLSLHVAGELVTQSDLLYGSLYDALGVPSVQHWSSYRPEASFRHPLPAALFLATSGVLAAGEAVRTGHMRWAVLSVPALIAAAATLSRSGVAGMLVGLLVLVLLWSHRRFPGSAQWRYPLAGVGLLVTVIGLRSGPLAERLDTIEATRSTEARTDAIGVAWDTATQYPWFGSGPGTADVAAAPFNPSGLPIESSLLQSFVSLGAVGLVLLLALVAWATWPAFRRGDVAVVSAIVAYLVVISLFNALEGRVSLLIYLGLLLALGRAGTDDPERHHDPTGVPVATAGTPRHR